MNTNTNFSALDQFESLDETDLENVNGGWIRVQYTGPNFKRIIHNNVTRRFQNLADVADGRRPRNHYI